MGLPESSLLTYLAWTDAMQRLSPSPLRGNAVGGREYCVGGRDPGGGGGKGGEATESSLMIKAERHRRTTR